MRVLWVTSQQLPIVANELNIKKNNFGGWVMNMINELKKNPEIEIGVAMSYSVKEMIKKEVDEITCYIANDTGIHDICHEDVSEIIADFKPDIIHVEGNEFNIHNKFIKYPSNCTLLSLQGILSGYEPYQYGELPIGDYLFFNKYKSRIFAMIMLLRKKQRFLSRVKIESETISNAKYIMGRTFWDKAHSHVFNQNATYFECNRILRPIFYKKHWSFDSCERYSIFVGNGYSPLKGLHFVLDALFILKKEYPNIKLFVAGVSPINVNKASIKYYGYSNLIRKKIKKLNIEENVIFLGEMQGDDMANRMLKSHVFVLPSLIENSPNTLGEAMLLGIPSVSSYCGGVSDMATDGKECLFYRANDPVLCAWEIKKIFDNDEFANRLSKFGRKKALITHDPQLNAQALLSSYNEILRENK